MEQGTGKTPVTIAAIEALNEEFGDTLSGLVLASSALKYQWRDEIAKFTGGTVDDKGVWTGGATCVVVDGTTEARIAAYKKIRREQPQYIILGYEQVVSDYELVKALPRDFMVGDEITAIKSPASQRAQALKTLDAPFIFGLTGTPMENGKPDEIFSIMEWIDASVLGRADMFDRTFVTRNRKGWIVGYKNLPLLHKTLSDAMVRVRRDDPEVAKYMPRKQPAKTHMVTLDRPAASVYRLIENELVADLMMAAERAQGSFDVFALYTGAGGAGDEIQGAIASKITCLRMLLTHPAILLQSAERYRDTEQAKVRQGSAYAHELLERGILDALDRSSAKFEAVIHRIDAVLDEGPENKMVVFSFFKGALQMLADAYGSEAVQFHGGMNASQKAAAKRRFQYDPSVRLFLSSDAGGYGVDLPQANYLLNVDLPYSKGKTDQRNSRHDRASSEHELIHTETFIVTGSIEEFYASKLASKGGVARAVIDGKGYDRRGRLELGANTLLAWIGENDV